MQTNDALRSLGFYQHELTRNILPFWRQRCLDAQNGGFFNCFDNLGETLVSRDKYTWSQGRFVWLWARLAMSPSDVFTASERADFLSLAKNGADFLSHHCLLPGDHPRCAFVTDEFGSPKRQAGFDRLDTSIYADCFVVMAFARYALASGDEGAFTFAEALYRSVEERLANGQFLTLPYPLTPAYRAHGIPMIMNNVTQEMLLAARVFRPSLTDALFSRLAHYLDTSLSFVDTQNRLREVTRADGSFLNGLLGGHINPGHTLEDLWFMADSALLLGETGLLSRLCAIARKTLSLGWDSKHGGLLHYCLISGDAPEVAQGAGECEPMVAQVLGGWGDKLWWVHSEALYATLRLSLAAGDETLLGWYEKLFDYAFRTFPNPNRDVREWIQILTRDGKPQEKIVALPVKDPYHIARNMLLIIELLSERVKTALAEKEQV